MRPWKRLMTLSRISVMRAGLRVGGLAVELEGLGDNVADALEFAGRRGRRRSSCPDPADSECSMR